MNELLKIILSLSVSGALLILVLLLCKPLVKDKLSKRWQYYIWLVVIARLLLPFAPETNLVGTLFQYIDNAVVQTDTSQRPEQQALVLPETDFSNQGNGLDQVGSGGEQSEPNTLVAPSIFDLAKQNIAAVCLLVWLIVAACLLIRKVTVYQSFVKYIKAGRTEISDMQLWERVGKLVEQTGVKGAVGLYTNSLISSPLLIGFFRPCIMLPTTELSESDFENTILHELTHYKRRDMFYKWLVQVTICLHWFNPLVYLMGREVNRTCELSCDEAVIRSMDEGGQRAYGDTLLNAMDTGGKYKDTLASVTLNESAELLKERLDSIMKFKKLSKVAIIMTVIFTMFVIVGATYAGTYAVAADNSQTNNSRLPTNAAGEQTLTLNVRSAAVDLQTATDGKISAEYNSNIYNVEISDQNSDWKVDISCKTQTNTNTETIKLFIPDTSYSNIRMNIDSAYLTSSTIKSGNIIGDFNTASVILTLPSGFNGSLDATVTSGYFELVSKDDFSNSKTTIIDDGETGGVYIPQSFVRSGNTSTFSNGNQDNVIKVTRKGIGVVGIYTSDYWDSVDMPSDSQSYWENNWERGWKEDWWKSWSPVQRIVYENVEMRRYEGEDGHPYIHNTKTNITTKEIVNYQCGMLAFDKDGNPLKIDWWSIDTKVDSTYFYLQEISAKILPAETYDVRGGWSLNFMGNDSSVANIAYVLYCDKEITFEDGTVWENPDFESWRTTYEGQKIDVNILENYYPYEQSITF